MVKLLQVPMSRSIQLHYIPVTAFSYTDLFLDRISLEWDSRGSAMTNHKKLIWRHWTGSAFLSQRERYTKNRSVCENAVTSASYGPTDRLLAANNTLFADLV